MLIMGVVMMSALPAQGLFVSAASVPETEIIEIYYDAENDEWVNGKLVLVNKGGYYCVGQGNNGGNGFDFTEFPRPEQPFHVIIPAEYNGLPVRELNNEALLGGDKMVGVTIPDSIEIIGNYAFYQTGLVNVTVPASVNSIGYLAFGNCKSLAKVVYETNASLSNIPQLNPFNLCSSIITFIFTNPTPPSSVNLFLENNVDIKIYVPKGSLDAYMDKLPAYHQDHTFEYVTITVDGEKYYEQVDVAITDIEQPTKDGYTFKGWYTDEELTTPFDGIPHDDTTLYPKWTSNVADNNDTTQGGSGSQKTSRWLYVGIAGLVAMIGGLATGAYLFIKKSKQA